MINFAGFNFSEIYLLGGGFFLGLFLSFLFIRGRKIKKAFLESKQAEIIEKSRKDAEEILKKAKSQISEIKKIVQEENIRLEHQLKRLEETLNLKELNLKRREERNLEIKKKLQEIAGEVKQIEVEAKQTEGKTEEELIKKTGLKKEEFKELLLAQAREQVLGEKDLYLKKIEEETKDDAIRQAQNILVGAIQKYAAPTSVEKKATNIKVKRDEFKAHLVGRESKNIELFEKLVEVDIIFNDLPGTITISGFDLVKRQIARNAIEKLMKLRGELNAERIKKAIKEAEAETNEIIEKAGQEAVKTIGLKNIPPELIKTIGRLKFRTSYGQNILNHSLEVAAFSTSLAYELGADVEVSRVAGFLHDIGKAVDFEVEGGHDTISKNILTEYGFSEEIIHAVYAHHEAVPCKTVEAVIVKAADAISAGRPGARQESLEKYLERLQILEETAISFLGVKKAFAISAGREIRVDVDPEKINDKGVSELAPKIANKIEKNLSYPGKIKVNVIRKIKAIDIAK